jgi:hypothetical protein
MTPAAALARHVEWLEYALGAARDEEAQRVRRLEKATGKNRGKRTARLAEVRDEIEELNALLQGIRDLRGTRTPPSKAVSGPRRTRSATIAANPHSAAGRRRPPAVAPGSGS